MNNLFITYYESPVGILLISGTDTSIKSLEFLDSPKDETEKSNAYLEKCKRQLDEYFQNKREQFELNLDPDGNEFQLKVWDELLKIPYGKTISYFEQSRRVGDVKSIRAVAKANSQNKIGIIIPCHRVIGADGSLVGFGGGLWRKKWLLEHESKITGEQLSLDI